MEANIRFVTSANGRRPKQERRKFSLLSDNWDDFHYKTMYQLIYVDDELETHEIGYVKIAYRSLTEDHKTPTVPERFTQLDAEYYSVGQGYEYYEELSKLGPDIRIAALEALNDIAFSPEILAQVSGESALHISLLRSIELATVENQYRRIAHGGVARTDFDFLYRYPKGPVSFGQESPSIDFKIQADSLPPTNVHVVIGSNGAGKTTLLRNMAKAIVTSNPGYGILGRKTGIIFQEFLPWSSPDGTQQTDMPFSNLVTVSFSAFDPFITSADFTAAEQSINFSSISLRGVSTTSSGLDFSNLSRQQSDGNIAENFVSSFIACRAPQLSKRWLNAFDILASDPILADSGIREFMSSPIVTSSIQHNTDHGIFELFNSLSSGHKIVLLTMTHMIEKVQEKSLVLLDEPESHLHPPLLSSLIRALSEILADQNGVAIIATHSPIVLQEVPKSCVTRISRFGNSIKLERVENETFGENIGTLTSTIFALEITNTGYHTYLKDVLDENGGDYARTLRAFDGQLGTEARAVLRNLAALRGSE